MDKTQLIYTGNSKKLFGTTDAGSCVLEFTDDVLDGGAKKTIKGKGVCNASISEKLFGLLEKKGVPTHFEKLMSENEMLVKRLEVLPLEVVVRNIVAGSLVKRIGLEEGIMLESPVMEFYFKNEALHDPMINECHVAALKLARPEQVERIKELAFKANGILKEKLEKNGVQLVDCMFEFGLNEGKVLLGDEISPDTCRLWDAQTREKLGKDGRSEKAYKEILKRISENGK